MTSEQQLAKAYAKAQQDIAGQVARLLALSSTKVQILTPEEQVAKAKALQQLLRLLALLVQKYKY